MELSQALIQLKESLAKYSKSPLLHISEAAELLRVSEEHLSDLAGKGRVRAFKVGEHWFMEESWIADFRQLVKQSLESEIDNLRSAAPHGQGWVRTLAPRRKLRLRLAWRPALSALFAFPINLFSSLGKLVAAAFRLAAYPFLLSWRLLAAAASGAQLLSGGALGVTLAVMKNSAAGADFAYNISRNSVKNALGAIFGIIKSAVGAVGNAAGLIGRLSFGSGKAVVKISVRTGAAAGHLVAGAPRSMGRGAVALIKPLARMAEMSAAASARIGRLVLSAPKLSGKIAAAIVRPLLSLIRVTAVSTVRYGKSVPQSLGKVARISARPFFFIADKSAQAVSSAAGAVSKELVISKNKLRLSWLRRHENFWLKERYVRINFLPLVRAIRLANRRAAWRLSSSWSAILSATSYLLTGLIRSAGHGLRPALQVFTGAISLAALAAMLAFLILPLAQVGLHRREIAARYLTAVYAVYNLPLAYISNISVDLPLDDENLTRVVYRWAGQNPPGQVAGAFEVRIR